MNVYTDAARDDDVAGFGWKIVSDSEIIEGNRYLIGNYTSMEAEYYALLDGLRFAKQQDDREIDVYIDCQPLVGKMRTPDSKKIWYDRRRGCHRMLNKFDTWSLSWIPREQNERANRLAYEALETGRREG